jgi:hypothetical protein
VQRAQLFFYLGAREERREGEQVLLTWALGPSAIKIMVKAMFWRPCRSPKLQVFANSGITISW